MKLKAFVAGIVLAVPCISANATWKLFSGNELQAMLESHDKIMRSKKGEALDRQDLNQSYQLMGLVGGIVDVTNGIVHCPSSAVPMGQYIAVVAKYMVTNPEKWNAPADGLILQAVSAAWPCEEKK